jgi:hypothetical protein
MKNLQRFMTLALLLTFALTDASWAQEKIIIKETQLSLADNVGRITSEELEYTGGPLRFYATPADFSFTLDEGLFHLEHPDFQASYDFGKEGLLSGIEKVQTQNFNLVYLKEKRVDVQSTGLLLSHSKGTQFLPAFNLKCSANAQKSLVKDVSGMCLHLGSLRVPVVEFDQLSGFTVAKALNVDELTNKLNIKSFNKGLDKIEELKVFVMNGDLNISFKARFLFNWTVKIKGSVNYSEENQSLTIKIDSARAGIFSVKKTVLKQIREANLSSIKVDGDVLTIKL